MIFAQEDTRTVVYNCVFTGTLNNPEAGDEWTWSRRAAVVANLTAQDPWYYIYDSSSSSFSIQKKNTDGTWSKIGYYDGIILTAGTYRYETQLRIANGIPSGTSYGDSYRLPDDRHGETKATLTVAGEEWTVGSDASIYSTYSYTWVISPEFEIAKKQLPFVFSFNNALNYGVQVINTPIAEKDLKTYTTGGTEEYSYRKLTNHVAWLNVSAAGIISGTPTAVSQVAYKDTIEVSDGVQKDTFAITAGKVAPLPADREVIASAAFTGWENPAVGDIYNNQYEYTFQGKMSAGAENYRFAQASNSQFLRKDGDNWVLMQENEAFAYGTYKWNNQIRCDGDYGYYYVLAEVGDLSVTINNEACAISSGSTADYYSYRFVSREFTLSAPEPTSDWIEIAFAEAVGASDLAADAEFTESGLKVAITDSENKMAIDANNTNFGTADEYTKYSFRLKSGGKSQNGTKKNYMTITAPADGVLRLAVRSASSTEETRTLVLGQGDNTLYNAVVKDADAIDVPISDEATTKVYPYVYVAVKAGEITVGYPVNGLNFYAFAFKAGGEVPTAIDAINQEPKAKSRKLIKNGMLLIEHNGKFYNVMGAHVQ